MDTQEKARKLMAESRQHQEHIEENTLLRSQQEIHQSGSPDIESKARELISEQRQHNQHLKETMLSRSESDMDSQKQ